MTLIIKTATDSGIRQMLGWARDEGWNPGIDDHIAFQAADPQGFFIGYLNQQPVASISAVRYTNEFGFIGLYIVKPDFRGQGLGITIWQHGMAYLQNVKIIGLDGVIAQQANYKKFGFKLAHRNLRYRGMAPNIKPTLPLTPLKQITLANILAYEHDVFPSARSLFLQPWLEHATASFAYVNNHQLAGYGVIRQCHEGYKIGPIFADDATIAEQLFLGLCQTVVGKQVFLDVPEPNQMAVQLAERFHLKPMFETARMYTHADPALQLNKIYGITTFELG